jgi:hypothetical protein
MMGGAVWAEGAGAGGEGESGGGGRRKRRQSRADPVLPRTTTPTLRFNSDDMLAPRRPRPPSIREHIIHSPRVTASATAAARLACKTPPPPNSPLPPTPLTATLTSGSPLSPMPPTPVLHMLPRCASPLSKMTEKTRVRPLPPLPLQRQQRGLSSASPGLHLPPPPPSSQPPPPQLQSQLQLPQAVTTTTTTTAPSSTAQAILLQPNRLHLPEMKERNEKEAPPPHSSSSLSRPLQRQNLQFTRLVGHRRRRAQDNNDSPPPYTSQCLDSDNDNPQN